jgi:hypothetical protein
MLLLVDLVLELVDDWEASLVVLVHEDRVDFRELLDTALG